MNTTAAFFDAGIERIIISSPIRQSFAETAAIMDGKASNDKARAILLVVKRNLAQWSTNWRQRNEAAQKRQARLAAREELVSSDGGSRRDDGSGGFRRTRGHRFVDVALDLYSDAATALLCKAKAAFPRFAGADASRRGRVATAPLRLCIDGQAQRQLLAILCGYWRPIYRSAVMRPKSPRKLGMQLRMYELFEDGKLST